MGLFAVVADADAASAVATVMAAVNEMTGRAVATAGR